MPLNKLKPALLRVSILYPEQFASTSQSPTSHPLHELLKPCLLTTRSCSEKWESEIPKLLTSEESSGSAEDELMWFTLKFEKMDESVEDEGDDTDQRWRSKIGRAHV